MRDTKLSKLDWIFFTHHFISSWPNANILALPRELSDRCPIILKTQFSDYGPIPIKIFNSWLSNKDFPGVVSNSWHYSPHHPQIYTQHPSISLKCKLQDLKNHIRSWRCNIGPKEDILMIREIKTQIELLDIKSENSGGLGSIDSDNRLCLLKKLEDMEQTKRLS